MSFDKYASKWDTDKRIKRAEEVATEIRKRLRRSEYNQALEFGCGTGLVSYNLIDMMNQITMVDTSKETSHCYLRHRKYLQYPSGAY